METIAQIVVENDFMNLRQTELDAIKAQADPGATLAGADGSAVYVGSLYRVGSALVAMGRIPESALGEQSVTGPAGAPGAMHRRLIVLSPEPIHLGFTGISRKVGSVFTQEVVPGAYNVGPLWEHFNWTRPVSLRNERTTVGMGDRVGLASSGHIRAARKFKVSPVLAQQSMRELAFTGRDFADVVSDAAFLVFQEGFESGYGADGDHLKTITDINRALSRGMPMITLDLTEVMNPDAAQWPESQINAAYERLPSDFRSRIERDFVGKSMKMESATIGFDEGLVRRCAVMYGEALAFSQQVNEHLDRMTGGAFDLEISVDETTTPTIPSHHLFIARDLERRGVQVNSLAPRFVGEFQKGIDYIGDKSEFEKQFRVHAEIAKAAGGYKVSVHSGSDKFGVYPVIGRETDMRLHLKTAGTSWLESLRTIAQTEPELYRKIHDRANQYFPEALKSYHITADVDSIAPLSDRTDEQLPDYLNENNCRQFLHISYGGLLRDPEIRQPYYKALHDHEAQHTANVEKHLSKHLELLGVDRV